jgi:hypothetical protein
VDLAGPEKADAAVSVDPLDIVDLGQLLTAPLLRADAAAVGHAADDTKQGAVSADLRGCPPQPRFENSELVNSVDLHPAISGSDRSERLSPEGATTRR